MQSQAVREAADPAEVDDPLRLDRQVCFALSVAARSVVALYRPVLEPMGLTHPQYLVMLALWERSPRSVKDLSSALALDPGTLSPLLKRLETAGLVRRRRDADDERSVVVSLTKAGAALQIEAAGVPAELARATGMSPSELKALRETLAALTAALTESEAR